ncbi:transcriptional regulator, BadM/Rrf2 family [Flavobacterium succinicans]|uniref:Transcriptional regulator, BadM/Rrf2 family n=2 Tax=Flavobacteriaceae TaxID=49546 RepID=A0A1I4RPT3_9FLAO|nr:transcriptional regulator, BadM/Rrf2 family [Flavobacterium succinicans]
MLYVESAIGNRQPQLIMLSKKTKYGIKALTFLARREDNTPVQIAEIAKAEHISLKFLESILLLLRHSGFLGAKKGKGGGYYLIKEPKDINMAKVYRILEGPIALLPCASHNFYEPCDDCNDEATCAVRKLMMEVRDNTLMILENNTLADIAF